MLTHGGLSETFALPSERHGRAGFARPLCSRPNGKKPGGLCGLKLNYP